MRGKLRNKIVCPFWVLNTSDIYSHLDYSSKITAADKIAAALEIDMEIDTEDGNDTAVIT